MLEAIKALQHEGTKAEVAQGFKERGNEMVAEKKWTDAKEFYTKGIAVLAEKSEGNWDRAEDQAVEEKQRTVLNEQLHVNRARCNLELSELDSVTRLRHLLTAQRTTGRPRWTAQLHSASTHSTSKHIIDQHLRFLLWTRSSTPWT